MFFERINEGIALVAMGRDGNNQMYHVAWAIVENETSESWTWFTEQLKVDLNIGYGLGWVIISDMQKVCIEYIAINILFIELELF